ncbi:MAG: transcription antitermination factor NusB [Fibrobacterota bacterium]
MDTLSKRQKRKARILALQVLYSYEKNEGIALTEVFDAVSHIPEVDLASNEGRRFAKELCLIATRRMKEIDAVLSRRMPNWRLERLAAIDRNVLRLGAAEMVSSCDTPVPVIINEAVEIVKEYGTDDSAGFINGVLDAVKSEISQEIQLKSE